MEANQEAERKMDANQEAEQREEEEKVSKQGSSTNARNKSVNQAKLKTSCTSM